MAQQTYVIRSERDRGFAVAAVMRAAKGLQVRISKPDRTNDQNAALHAVLSQIADQLPWPKDTGEMHDIVWWKRRATLGWLLDTKQEVEIITPLIHRKGDEEDFALLLPHTSDLKVDQHAALREWATMFGATNGVVFKDVKPPEPPPEAYE